MAQKELIKKYQSRLIVEGLLKSGINGLIAGFTTTIIIKIIFLIIKENGLLWPIISGLIVAIIASLVFYFIRYRPNTKKVASRVDDLGLEERVVTMLSYENQSNSFMVEKQKKDTEVKLTSVSPKQLKLSVFTIPFIILLCLVPLTASTLTISSRKPIISSTSSIPKTSEEINVDDAIAELIAIIRGANITTDQKNELFTLVDQLIERLEEFPTFDGKMNEISKTKDEILKKIEEFIIDNLLITLHEIIEKAEVSDEFKITMHALVDSFKETLKQCKTIEEKIQSIKDFIPVLQDRIIEEAVRELYELVDTAEAPGDIKALCYDLIHGLEDRIANVHETYNAKMEDIKETKEEILKLLFPPEEGDEPQDGTTTEELDDMQQEIGDALDKAISDLEEVAKQGEGEIPVGEQPIEDEQDDNNEEDETDDKQMPPPPPVEGEIHIDAIINGLTDYIDELEKLMPGIREMLEEGNLSEEMKAYIEYYLSIIVVNTTKE